MSVALKESMRSMLKLRNTQENGADNETEMVWRWKTK